MMASRPLSSFAGWALAFTSVLTLSATLVGQSYTIASNTPGLVKKAVDQGAVDPSTKISVTAWLKLRNENQLQSLMNQQQQKGNASFHKWISQQDFNATYGPTAQQLKAVQNFMKAHGLTVDYVAENNMFVKASGTVAAVQKAFHVSLHNYKLNGKVYRANTADPSINDASGGNVAAITGLDDYGFQPAIARVNTPEGKPVSFTPLSKTPDGVFFEGQCFRAPQTVSFSGGGNTATYTGNRYGSDITNSTLGHLPPCGYSPAEVQTAYQLLPLYSSGLNGAGQTIVIVDAYGSPTIQQDADLFSQVYGLPPVSIDIYRSPGLINSPYSSWQDEVTLDVEWAHAIAPGAKLALVTAPANNALDEAINYAVVHHLGNTISNSWSTVEGFGNPAQFGRVDRILWMAAVQGIDVNFSSGDYGDYTPVYGFRTVAYPASSPYATGIGGTTLALSPQNTMLWQSGWGNNLTILSNTAANGYAPYAPPVHEGFVFGAGGGASLIYPKPAFQTGVPGTKRQVPDIGWLADPYTGAEIIETINGEPSVGSIGGTSLACPMFSGLMAIAAQKAGHGLGQAAPLVYGLASSSTNSSAPIYDVVPVSSATNVTGVVNGTAYSASELAAPLYNTTAFYSALYNSPNSTRWFDITFGTDTSLTTNPGWDNVTGVGTPNGVHFVNAIVP